MSTVGLLLSALTLFSDLYEIRILVAIMSVSRNVSMRCRFAMSVKTQRLVRLRPVTQADRSVSHKLFLRLSTSTNSFAVTAQQWLEWKTLDSPVCSHYPSAQLPLNF